MRRAGGFAIAGLVAVAAVGWPLTGGLTAAAVTLLDPSFGLLAILVVVGLGALRVAATLDAFVGEGGWAAGRVARAVLAAVIVATVAMHALAGYYAWAFWDAGSRIFGGDDPGGQVAPTPTVPSETPSATETLDPIDVIPTPAATPETRSSRVNILLTGLDSGHDRTHSLSDTLLVVSIDPAGRTVAMVSFPRDISNFPLYDGGTYDGKINSFLTYARRNADRYTDGPMPALASELGFLLGVPVHYTAAVNLEGFESMIDLVGGVDIVNQRRIADPTYDWFDGTYGFYLSAGKHHLDGRTALAYVRSRKGAADNDFTRAARQQELLIALRDRMTDPDILGKLPAILDAAARTVRTNFPPDRLREFLGLAEEIGDDAIRRVVLGPPYAVHPPTDTTGGIYTLRLYMDKVAALSVELFGRDSAYLKETAPTATPDPREP